MQSAKLSPANSLSGLKMTGGDPTNKSVIEDNFKDNDSLNGVNKHRRHKSNRGVGGVRPLQMANQAGKAIMGQDPELDQISSI